jgi:glycosyltransferase involved in cell wall biosynthesis
MDSVSVVVPSYLRADLLPETLQAIFGQSRVPDEVIVVDGGSTDETPKLLSNYGDRLYVIRVRNGGDLAARNVGAKPATGIFVAFCDSDDTWEEDFLANMLAMFPHADGVKGAYSNFRLLTGGHLMPKDKFADARNGYWSAMRVVAPSICVFDQDLTERLLKFQPFFPSCLMVDRAAFLHAGGWDEGVRVGSDFATALHVGALPPAGIVTTPLVRLRKHIGNLSAITERTNVRDADVLEHVLRTRNFGPSVRHEIERSMTDKRVAAIESAFARRDFYAMRTNAKLVPWHSMQPRCVAKLAIAALFVP